jgi:hypothetical protein
MLARDPHVDELTKDLLVDDWRRVQREQEKIGLGSSPDSTAMCCRTSRCSRRVPHTSVLQARRRGPRCRTRVRKQARTTAAAPAL